MERGRGVWLRKRIWGAGSGLRQAQLDVPSMLTNPDGGGNPVGMARTGKAGWYAGLGMAGRKAAKGREARGNSGELALIERVRRAAAGTARRGELRLGIGDDCAILQPRAAEEVVVTTDFSLEGRHFTRDRHTPQSVGHRVLARGLSDLAAMGARPVAAFLSLALPQDVARNTRWMNSFLAGLTGLAKRAQVPLAGGDTSESPADLVLADIVLLGAVAAGTALRRNAARAGDAIYVTGALGGAAAELGTVLAGNHVAESSNKPSAADRLFHGAGSPHLFPEPRLHVGMALRQRALAAACIDLSDGLSTDLAHVCAASNVGAEIELAALPLHARSVGLPHDERVRLALHGGEDYELLFTARPGTKVPRRIAGVPVTRVGTVVRRRRGRPQVELVGTDGERTPLEPGGWEHLR